MKRKGVAMTDFATITSNSYTIPTERVVEEQVSSSKINLGTLPEVADKVFGQHQAPTDARWTKVACTLQRNTGESECDRGIAEKKSKSVITGAQGSNL